MRKIKNILEDLRSVFVPGSAGDNKESLEDVIKRAQNLVAEGLREKACEVLKRALDEAEEKGDSLLAERILKELIEIDPGNPDYYCRLGELYEVCGRVGESVQVYGSGLENTGAARFKAKIRRLSTCADETCGGELAKLMLDLFPGREGVFAKQWIFPDGEVGYIPVERNLSASVLMKHLKGEETVGIYVVRRNNTVKLIAFDVDVKKHLFKEPVVVGSDLFHEILDFAGVIKRKLSQLGMPSYLEYSGAKGIHLWVFLNKSTPCREAFDFCKSLLSDVEVPHFLHVDFFPRQPFVKQNGYGNLIKLPLGIHRKTGIRSCFLNDDGTTVEQPLEFLLSVEKTSLPRVIAVPFDIQAPVMSEAQDEKEDAEPEEDFTPFKDTEFISVVNNCKVLNELVNKAVSGQELTEEEISVITYTLGNLTSGNRIVNFLFDANGRVPEDCRLKNRLNGYPMSCSKIRKKLGLSWDFCSCEFSEVHRYPSPINFAVKEFKGPKDIQGLITEYIRLKEQVGVIQHKIGEVEGELLKFFEESGVECVRTAVGVVRMIDKDGRKTFVLEV
ncbi:MAG: hypothetical protein GXO44_01675 [Deferribacteres bacterium]|nr:hypothetical protein [Deferribacteres bacterium]